MLDNRARSPSLSLKGGMANVDDVQSKKKVFLNRAWITSFSRSLLVAEIKRTSTLFLRSRPLR